MQQNTLFDLDKILNMTIATRVWRYANIKENACSSVLSGHKDEGQKAVR
jgi:hypothetical protein